MTRALRCVWTALLAVIVSSCAPLAPRIGSPAQWRPSANFDERRPNFVIIHNTADDTAEQALTTLTDPLREVSSHYLIDRNGTLYQLVDERARAWHAGQSQWGGETDLNSASIGIELDNNGHEPYPDAQISALLRLLADLEQRYRIPSANFLGHGDVAPRRKVDPGTYFPWQRLATQGYGLWCDAPYPAAPAAFDAVLALKAIGYDVSNVDAATQAFKRHFAPPDATPDLSAENLALLYCLTTRSLAPDSLAGETRGVGEGAQR
jgi:N-acetylmuramoyl-L-alanine amidase